MSFYNKLYYGDRTDATESPKNRFKLFFYIISANWRELIKLNMLYLLLCIPIFTIGAATSALSYVIRKIDEEEYVFVVSDFWDSFKENFKNSTIYWLIYAASMCCIIFGIKFCDSMIQKNATIMVVPILILIIIGILILFAGFYGFCMLGNINLKLKDIIRNSYILAVIGLKKNFLILLCLITLTFASISFFPFSVFLLIPFGASFIALLIIHNIYPIMKKLITI